MQHIVTMHYYIKLQHILTMLGLAMMSGRLLYIYFALDLIFQY